MPIRVNTAMPYIAAASLLLVFITDVFTPPKFAVDILYLCTILLVSGQQTRTILIFALMACALILVDEDIVFLDHHRVVTAAEWVNRGISVTAILITALIAVRYRLLAVAAAYKEQQRLDDMNEMLFITSHEVRRPLANILGLLEVLDIEGEAQPAVRQQLAHLRTAAAELDELVQGLNTFMETSGQPAGKAVFPDGSGKPV